MSGGTLFDKVSKGVSNGSRRRINSISFANDELAVEMLSRRQLFKFGDILSWKCVLAKRAGNELIELSSKPVSQNAEMSFLLLFVKSLK